MWITYKGIWSDCNIIVLAQSDMIVFYLQKIMTVEHASEKCLLRKANDQLKLAYKYLQLVFKVDSIIMAQTSKKPPTRNI